MTAPVIAVDGPGGSGKGTLAEALAGRLGWHLLDSGALYRIVALAASQRGVATDDAEGLVDLTSTIDIAFEPQPGGVHVWLDGEDVSTAIRADSIGTDASRVAAVPALRAALLVRQRAFCQAPGLVADGRDMGTVVFPSAELKIFLDASARERALRRHKQLIDKGLGGSLRALLVSIQERDERDRQRAVSPLVPAGDAIVIDSTALGVDAVLARVWELIEARELNRLHPNSTK